MKNFFEQIFSKNPDKEENRIFYFNADDDGDYFSENDINEWRTIWFQNNWNEHKLLENKASHHLISAIIKAGSPIIELACGPAFVKSRYHGTTVLSKAGLKLFMNSNMNTAVSVPMTMN